MLFASHTSSFPSMHMEGGSHNICLCETLDLCILNNVGQMSKAAAIHFFLLVSFSKVF